MRVRQRGVRGSLLGTVAGCALLCALAIPAQGAPAATDALTSAPAMFAPPRPDAAARLDGLLDGFDESEANLAVLAQLERQGDLAAGTVDALLTASEAAAAMPPPGPPENVYRDVAAFCDVNGDGFAEALANDYSLLTQRPTLRMLDGRTGRSLWIETNTMWLPWNGMPQSFRALDPVPLGTIEPKNTIPTVDLNGDGICDFYTHTFALTGNGPLQSRLQGFIRAHSGAGAFLNLWQFEYTGLFANVNIPLLGGCGVVQGFPTGFEATVLPDNTSRLAFKTSDLYQCSLAAPEPTCMIDSTCEVRFTNRWNADHVLLFQGTSNVPLWTRDLDFDTGSNRTEFRWLSGLGSLDEQAGPEVVLDQMWITNPRSSQGNHDNPMTGEPMTRNGRGMEVLALSGADGATLWTSTVWDDLAVRANPPAQEEGFETMVGTYAYVLGDINGDHLDDVMAQVLAQEFNEVTSTNGAFRTHFVPLSGADGADLWGTVRYQGWGHAQRIAGPGDAVRVAVGTMDVYTDIPPLSRFPPKDLRLAVLHAEDGSALWSHRAQYPQDSMLGYDIALQQYRLGLAPFDVDGDGWPDVVTPGQYIKPKAGQQVLLSQATQRFEVLSGASGRELLDIEAFGSNGMLLPCGEHFVAVGGYGGHLEVQAFDLRKGKEAWGEVLFIDPTPTSAVAGIDMTFLSVRCMASDDNRTFVGVNAGLFSQKRNSEILNLYGYPHSEMKDEDGQDPVWYVPNHLSKGELLDKLAALLAEPEGPSSGDRLVWAAVPTVPGLLLGGLAGIVANRRAPLPPRPTKAQLPDLYGDK